MWRRRNFPIEHLEHQTYSNYCEVSEKRWKLPEFVPAFQFPQQDSYSSFRFFKDGTKDICREAWCRLLTTCLYFWNHKWRAVALQRDITHLVILSYCSYKLFHSSSLYATKSNKYRSIDCIQLPTYFWDTLYSWPTNVIKYASNICRHYSKLNLYTGKILLSKEGCTLILKWHSKRIYKIPPGTINSYRTACVNQHRTRTIGMWIPPTCHITNLK